jgi:hypothetical protein
LHGLLTAAERRKLTPLDYEPCRRTIAANQRRQHEDWHPGVVILRFPTADITIVDSAGASSSTVGGDTVLTWNASGTFEFTIAAGGVTRKRRPRYHHQRMWRAGAVHGLGPAGQPNENVLVSRALMPWLGAQAMSDRPVQDLAPACDHVHARADGIRTGPQARPDGLRRRTRTARDGHRTAAVTAEQV